MTENIIGSGCKPKLSKTILGLEEDIYMKICSWKLISIIVMLSVGLGITTAWAADEKASGVNWFNIISAFVAVSAFILSQVPPIKKWFKGKRLRQVVAQQLQFIHGEFGLTYIYLWIDLENIGGETIIVKRIKGFLFLNDTLLQPLIANTYWLTESLSSATPWTLPFSEVALKPDERWSRYITLAGIDSYTKDIELKIKDLILKVKEDATKKERERNSKMADTPIEKRPPIEVDMIYVDDALKIVDKLKKIQVGDYKLLICAYDDPDDKEDDKKPLATKGFEFTLYPDQVNDIFKDIDKDQYKYGYGLDLPTQVKLKPVYINIRSISADRTQEILNRL